MVQRRGYFSAGIGLSTGSYLDENSQRLTELMVRADAGMIIGDATALVNALIEFVSILFQIHPFTTTSLASNWQDVLRRWLNGQAVGDIQGFADKRLFRASRTL